MVDESGKFEVLSTGEMRAKYGLTAENRPTIVLDPRKVPESLRILIPLAERFGIGDDLIREDYVQKCPKSDLVDMKKAVEDHQDQLEAWLTGPESKAPTLSREYVAFTCLLMSADAV